MELWLFYWTSNRTGVDPLPVKESSILLVSWNWSPRNSRVRLHEKRKCRILRQFSVLFSLPCIVWQFFCMEMGETNLFSSIERTSISNGSSRNAGFFSPAEIGICRVQNPLVAQHTKECIHKIDHIWRNKCEDP